MKQTRPDDSNGITPEISVVVLCYRAGQGVYFISDQVKQVLESITNNWEMILVGNYDVDCHDKTPEIVRGIADKDSRIKSVTHEKQGRMGWDAVTGLKAATGETISFIDGDGQMPVEDIKSVYDTLINDSLDIVLTYRVDRMDGRQRWFMSRVYNIIFNLMFPGYIVRDVNSKPKIFTRRFFRTTSTELHRLVSRRQNHHPSQTKPIQAWRSPHGIQSVRGPQILCQREGRIRIY